MRASFRILYKNMTLYPIIFKKQFLQHDHLKTLYPIFLARLTPLKRKIPFSNMKQSSLRIICDQNIKPQALTSDSRTTGNKALLILKSLLKSLFKWWDLRGGFIFRTFAPSRPCMNQLKSFQGGWPQKDPKI